MVQVVTLAEDALSGEYMGFITDPLLDGVASGALFGNSVYVNGARYFSELVSEKWITKLNIYDIESLTKVFVSKRFPRLVRDFLFPLDLFQSLNCVD